MKESIITYKGQVTIPKKIREALGLMEHDRVIFVVVGDKAIMRPVRVGRLGELRGLAKGRGPFPGREAEREAAKEHVAEHVVPHRSTDR